MYKSSYSSSNYRRSGRLSASASGYKSKRSFSVNNGFRPHRSNYGKQGLDVSLLVRKAEATQPEKVYVSTHKFSDFLINDKLKQNILSHGYISPTPIQDQTIPLLLEGKDIVGLANTGTGKTAAFLIPLINKMYGNKNEKVLIIAPTRELALQIDEECKLFSTGMNIYSILCIGGTNIQRQMYGLKRGPDIVIGTPGRLLDLKNRGSINFANYNSIVLDEVDRMLDMGFIKDIKTIISYLPAVRQSLFFSATMPSNVREVMDRFSRNAVTVSVKTQQAPANIEQDVVSTRGKAKIDTLHDLLIKKGFDKVLIFGKTKWGVEKLSEQLSARGFSVSSLHSNKTQNQRKKVLQQFKESKVNIMLATDVASRGLDIDDITHVINYDLPDTYEEYLHRIGRTGRANKRGIALSFVD